MRTCLIVDDSRVIRKVSRHILETLGFAVEEAENGKLAFDTRLNDWEQDARLVLNRELRHTIMSISPETAASASAKLAAPQG